MRLQYGGYSFPFNATLIDVNIETLFNSGLPYGQKHTYNVQGYLSVNGQADATGQESALRTALAFNFQDLLFFNDDGSLSALRLRNFPSLTGVHITNLRFPTTDGPEYATIRSFAFTAECTYALPNVTNLLVEFHETMTFEGGLPVFAHRLALEGPNQKQLIWPQDTFRATQSGSATMMGAPPFAPPPRWPFALVRAGKIGRSSPERVGIGYLNYSVTWEYEFESIEPLIGLPGIWIF